MRTMAVREDNVAAAHAWWGKFSIRRVFALFRMVHISYLAVPFLLYVFAALFVTIAKTFNSVAAALFFPVLLFSVLLYRSVCVLKRGGEFEIGWRTYALMFLIVVVTIILAPLLVFGSQALREAWRVY